MSQYGILIVSHVFEIAEGAKRLIEQVAAHVSVSTAGGLEDGSVGTSLERIQEAIDQNTSDTILAFYDLGSAKMNLEICSEMTDKKVYLFNAPIIEGAYSAAALAEVDVPISDICAQLQELEIK
ncbi:MULTISPECIES: dihydroxyacetone kinase phosphoryl donor subunit DhaM [unclassified Enterococcus]|uniref:dihydroxyacetone kinase phosphoryl donor subunit DhaM n=1 Tax=unclassified Enterococcus TaxID=2608891 RepID=UPI001556ECF0|nr:MULTISPECIES: dihydroxyacetone kinase phosphoryl donor subunit DhaM [unclassified Enterococcus]MBS7576077.1 PTS-dependent dihydroxyacetone kinase phosphotransferase subunit DhaM [Enterococcus sp. MMGLQ5-2]MBS7583310.1 PTS-dependent dihydroxyacetone kinase phosphotransferase subunit DhaM [Enterococcus sp. MMGLQ5-1]NPD11170.1 PTS-dependent dihydroxyacetone kinase phosphotransferase subunit DhaM [Enterococcus sp. MMGLQ5-1]NPD35913.1 PTS-dependent dihydroxyacetone kinase phosphotransferase subun